MYQWTVLLGNNNTGKTSLLKAIADLRAVPWNGHSLKQSKVLITEKDGGGKQFVPAGIRWLFNNLENPDNPDEGMAVKCTLDRKTLSYGVMVIMPVLHLNIRDWKISGFMLTAFPVILRRPVFRNRSVMTVLPCFIRISA